MQNPDRGGAFKEPGTSQAMNHGHASQMAHAASSRLAMARALSGAAGARAAPGASLAGPSPALNAMPQNHPANYKAAVSGIAAHHGVSAGPSEIHSAIGRLAQKGHFTPFQAQSLVAHNGPLAGPQGHSTVHKIAQEVVLPRPAGAMPGPMAGGGMPAPPGAMPGPMGQ